MLRNYLLTASKVFMRRKIFTAINLACIVLTLVVLMVVTSLLEASVNPGGVESKSNRFLHVSYENVVANHGHVHTSSTLGFKMIDKYLKPMPGVERVAMVSFPLPAEVDQGERVSQLGMRYVDADYWKVLDFTLLAGRLPNADDDAKGRQIAVLNQSSARRLFAGSASDAIGREIEIGTQKFEVVGVVADEAPLHSNAFGDVWAPISAYPDSTYRQNLQGPFSALVLANKASDLPRVRHAIMRIAHDIKPDDPKWVSVRFRGESKLDELARQVFSKEWQDGDSGAAKLPAMIGGAMLLFMLLPALNLVNLNAGRIAERSSEIGVRKAFGATGMQLAAQFVVENILLCLIGGLLALTATAGVLNLIEASDLIPHLKVPMDLAIFGYGVLFSCLFGVLSSAIPAWKMSRLDPVHALKGNA
jgi:putative ABC transport system permease protein